jgi:hypothetical protein
MKRILQTGFVLAALLGAAALPARAEIIVEAPPPAVIQETVPVAPGPAFVWTPGYWSWSHQHYVWRHGRYRRAPFAGAVWETPRWAAHGHRWHYRRGHWRH